MLEKDSGFRVLQANLGYQFTDTAYSSLESQIALQADCLKNDRSLDLPVELLEDIRTAPIFSLAWNVHESNPEIPAEAVTESEIGYLSVSIKCAQ